MVECIFQSYDLARNLGQQTQQWGRTSQQTQQWSATEHYRALQSRWVFSFWVSTW